ncbi:hypothetical protein [Sphingomonas qomolangmaensis]|uniref:Uncharacterized protein n=1 Tax=Sphingomonas qomolangmaensis TaxID=2918765 RepID=A0ABY5LF34_9SPHN|nr:hypothetical protein [Sphingomonas qomolangmaensis]UUL83326.1 hypothetical protein NMP03_03585 [Sphingomonas qomolangmaensis]
MLLLALSQHVALGPVESWKHANQTERRATVLAITQRCELPPAAIELLSGGEVVIQPPQDARYEAVACMMEQIGTQIGFSKVGFLGNEQVAEEKKK